MGVRDLPLHVAAERKISRFRPIVEALHTLGVALADAFLRHDYCLRRDMDSIYQACTGPDDCPCKREKKEAA